jgi:glycosyltransferase involved in cell wall biosynthesis
MTSQSPKILVLSAYDTPSHKHWRNLLHHLDAFHWTQLSLPPRYFAWRLRGNSLTWGLGKYPELQQTYDLIIATSMVDISTLRGFRPNLAQAPLIVYFHENQFDYPQSEFQREDIQLQLTTIYNAACADLILFNSEYNRCTFLKGASALLKKMPDGVPKSLMQRIEARSKILPVPIHLEPQHNIRLLPNSELHLLWNHRWEYDKNPETLFAALQLLKQHKIPFTIDVLGQGFRRSPDIFNQAKTEFRNEIRHWGYQPKDIYQSCLNECNLVISTAFHDFQGLALQEAIACGCLPIAPNRVAYPEYVPSDLLYEINTTNEAEQLANKIMNVRQQGFYLGDNPVTRYTWSQLKPQYEQVINGALTYDIQ